MTSKLDPCDRFAFEIGVGINGRFRHFINSFYRTGDVLCRRVVSTLTHYYDLEKPSGRDREELIDVVQDARRLVMSRQYKAKAA